MKDPMTTVLTERGQISVPSKLRRRLHLKTGQRFLWQPIADSTMRVVVLPEEGKVPGPLGVLGWAERFFKGSRLPRSDEALRELREGETDILIGAFALRRGGLVTRNPDHFQKIYSGLKIQVP